MIVLHFFVEEPSAEAALIHLVPKILSSADFEFDIFPFQGKRNLLHKLPDRLKAYRHWITEQHRLIVLVDRDEDDCIALKKQLQTMAVDVGLTTRAEAPGRFQVMNRIAVEELEAWYFGDVDALRAAYPRVEASLGEKAGYRDPDAIRGGTWERLEEVLKPYHPGGLEKIRAADEIARHMDPDANRSKSFQVFRDGLRQLITQAGAAPAD